MNRMLRSGALVLALIGVLGEALAQAGATEEELGWSNSTDLSVVIAQGNADTQSFALANLLHHHWKQSNFQFKVDVLQTHEAADRFLLVEPGLTWLPGENPPPGSATVVEPPLEIEAARFFVEGKYDHEFKKVFYWSVGASWDRNEDAGILNRYIAFGGFGRNWWDREDLLFRTAWALSVTDREEDELDPQKDQTFAGMRFSWNYRNRWGKLVVYRNDFTANVSLKDPGDFSLDMTNSLAVSLSHHLALKIGLQVLFESEPALEDVDVVALVELFDPDGIPGSGDEYFETVEAGGYELIVDSGDIRKEQLDEIFKTSLVVKF